MMLAFGTKREKAALLAVGLAHLASTGGAHLAYLVHERGAGTVAPRDLSFHTIPEAWVGIYEEMNAVRFDPALLLAKRRRQPVVWVLSELMAKRAPWSIEQWTLMKKAVRFGLTGGLSIPLYGSSSAFATFSLIMRCKPGLVRPRIQASMDAWRSYAELVHGWAMDVALRRGDLPELTFRQQMILELYAQGYRTARVAERIGVDEKTINYHVSRAKDALGAKTLPHAVVLAMSFGHIRPAPWIANQGGPKNGRAAIR